MVTPICDCCSNEIHGGKRLWEYKGQGLLLCLSCAALPTTELAGRMKPRLREIDRALKAQEAAQAAQERAAAEQALLDKHAGRDLSQLETLLVHGFLDMIQERKLAGRRELVATHAQIAAWLAERTNLAVTPRVVSALTLAMRDGGLLAVGGGGIGQANTYDTTEDDMGIEAFWTQVDAFLLAWQVPNRLQLLA